MTAYVDRARRLAGDQPALRVRPLLRFDPAPPGLAGPGLAAAPLEIEEIEEIEEEVEAPSSLSAVDYVSSGHIIHRRNENPAREDARERRPLPVPHGERLDDTTLEPASRLLPRDQPVEAPTAEAAVGLDRAPLSEDRAAPAPPDLGRAPVTANRQLLAAKPAGTRGQPTTEPDEPVDRRSATPAKAQARQPKRSGRQAERAEVATLSTDRQPPRANADHQQPTTDHQQPTTDRRQPVPQGQPSPPRPRRVADWTVTPDSRPDEITVTIGRIEVKVVPAPAPAPTKQAMDTSRPEPTRLDDYLKARASGRVG